MYTNKALEMKMINKNFNKILTCYIVVTNVKTSFLILNLKPGKNVLSG